MERLGAEFDGSWGPYSMTPDGKLLALGQKGTETQLYQVDGAQATKLPGKPGTYSDIDAAKGSGAIVVRYSTINDPEQAYLVANPLEPDQLKKLTDFNRIFTERAQPEWQTYHLEDLSTGGRWKGVLIFPPGKKGAKHLRMLTLIHGGPEDADGNRFGADWYDWATLAADRGWLVFRPNYRGSTGYGDDFMLAIQPHLVSAPGKDILAGVDALVRDGYADPDKLTIGGYSYGGYMTNWLITQTTRVQGGGDRRGRGGACGQLGQRRSDAGRCAVPGRPAVGEPGDVSERGGAVPVQQGEDAGASGAGAGGCAGGVSGRRADGAGIAGAGDSARIPGVSRARGTDWRRIRGTGTSRCGMS